MKKLLTLALALVALAVFTGLGVAQQKGEEKKPAAAPVMEQQARPQQIIGEVTRVDPKTNTFTVKGKDFEVTLPKQGSLPNVGQRIKITIECSGPPWHCTITISW